MAFLVGHQRKITNCCAYGPRCNDEIHRSRSMKTFQMKVVTLSTPTKECKPKSCQLWIYGALTRSHNKARTLCHSCHTHFFRNPAQSLIRPVLFNVCYIPQAKHLDGWQVQQIGLIDAAVNLTSTWRVHKHCSHCKCNQCQDWPRFVVLTSFVPNPILPILCKFTFLPYKMQVTFLTN